MNCFNSYAWLYCRTMLSTPFTRLVNPSNKSKIKTHGVKVLPGPFSAIDLILKFFCHDSLCVLIIQMGKIHYNANHDTELPCIPHIISCWMAWMNSLQAFLFHASYLTFLSYSCRGWWHQYPSWTPWQLHLGHFPPPAPVDSKTGLSVVIQTCKILYQ